MTYNAENIFEPVESGMIKKFKPITEKLPNAIVEKLPSIFVMGAQYPELAGGALYFLNLLTKQIPDGSPAINSISRRFAEHKHTKKQKHIRSILQDYHSRTEKQPNLTIETSHPLVNQELQRAKITRELYDMKQITVPVIYAKDGKPVDLGMNASACSILNPNSTTEKTTVFICSSGGNPPGAEPFIVEYAMQTKNKVLVLGQPDGAGGSMSEKFAAETIRDATTKIPPDYAPHTAYFKALLRQLLPDSQEIDLYSHSGGGIIAKNILNDPDFQYRVNNAVFLNPAGSATFFTNHPQLFRTAQMANVAGSAINQFPNTFRTHLEKDSRSSNDPAFLMRDKVTVAFQDGSHYKQSGWNTMKTNEKIILYVGGRDKLVGGNLFAKEASSFTNAQLLYDPKAYHDTPFTHPEETLHTILNKLN